MSDNPDRIDRALAEILDTEATRAALDAASPPAASGPPTPRMLATDAMRLAMAFLQLDYTDAANLDKAITWLATAEHYGAPRARAVRQACRRLRDVVVDGAARRLLTSTPEDDDQHDPHLVRALYELAESIVADAEATAGELLDDSRSRPATSADRRSRRPNGPEDQ